MYSDASMALMCLLSRPLLDDIPAMGDFLLLS